MVAEGARGAVFAPVPCSGATGPAVTRPTAIDPVGTRSRPGGVGLLARWVICIPVVTPLPHIAQHVIQPKGILLFLGHRVRLITTVYLIPRNVVPLAVPGTFLAGSRRVLPLRLGGQTVAFTGIDRATADDLPLSE